jgi:hypothetical protein
MRTEKYTEDDSVTLLKGNIATFVGFDFLLILILFFKNLNKSASYDFSFFKNDLLTFSRKRKKNQRRNENNGHV